VSAERLENAGSQRPLLKKQIVLGTRGSDLALAQARMAEEALRKKCGTDVRVEIIRTRGDESVRTEGRKGLFTRELEKALIDERIDVAVHSAKDLPSNMDGALTIAAALPRGAVEDLLITKGRLRSSFGMIATGSVRRQRQVRWFKRAREIMDLRGNVPTRLRKFAAGNWDAIVLARAGLERLGYSAPEFEFEQQIFFAQILPIEQFVPAGGQGVIALQTRRKEAAMLLPIDHRKTHICLRAERRFLRLLEGDCDLPVGAHAQFLGDEMELCVQLFGKDAAPRTAVARGNDPEKLAEEVFRKLEREHDCKHEHE
jgi:hydroxymethylbilane synthase